MPEVAQGEENYVVGIGVSCGKERLDSLFPCQKTTIWGKTVGVISPSLGR